MFLLIILTIMAIIVALVAVAVIALGGSLAVVIFSDLIVCVIGIITIIKKLIFKRKE